MIYIIKCYILEKYLHNVIAGRKKHASLRKYQICYQYLLYNMFLQYIRFEHAYMLTKYHKNKNYNKKILFIKK